MHGGAGLTAKELMAVLAALMKLSYVEIRRSTSWDQVIMCGFGSRWTTVKGHLSQRTKGPGPRSAGEDELRYGLPI